MIAADISNNVLWSLTGLYVVLIVASACVLALRWSRPEKDLSELAARTRTWWIMIVVFTIAMLVSRTLSLVFFAFISFLALKEYFSMIPTRRADRRVLLWAYLSIPAQYYWAAIGWYGMFIIFIPVYVFLFLPLRMIMIGETRNFLNAAGSIQWGLMTTVFSISHLAFLLVLPAEVNPDAGGAGLVLFVVFLTQFNDVAQYVWGKLLGRRKIVPSVSPGKTWEGFLGGVVMTVLLAFLLAPLLTPMDRSWALAAGLLIAVSGFIGDVTVSALKRDLEVKDSGNLLPGHGGVLDRIDSLTYTAPLFFHFVVYLYY